MGVPELDLVMAFTGGNYSQAATFTAQRVLVPQYVLPAVADSPVRPRNPSSPN
jgi:hypothetical protein